MKYLREADRVTMLLEDEIEDQLRRDRKKTPDVTGAQRIKFVIERFVEEAALYGAAGFGAAAVAEYGFISGTLFRTLTGWNIFERLVQQAYEKYGVPETEQQVRSELRKPEIQAKPVTSVPERAIAAATELQRIKLQTELIPLANGATHLEMRLTDLILEIEKRTGEPVPPAVSPDQGAYVTLYDEGLIRDVLALKASKQVAEGVVIVVMANSAAQVQEVHRVFRAQIRSGQLEVVMGGANAVAERLSRKYGRSRVQVKPSKSVAEDKQAFLTAALLANGRVVFVKTVETVQDAYQITVLMMLEASFAAAQAFAESA